MSHQWTLTVKKYDPSQPRVPSGSSEGGQWASGSGDVGWAEGVVAARRLGGQVPQRAVNEAERILSREGLKPSQRKAPKRFDDIAKFYEKTKPVVGDTWTSGNINIEVAKLSGRPTGGLSIDLWVITPKEGYSKTVHTDNDWGYESAWKPPF